MGEVTSADKRPAKIVVLERSFQKAGFIGLDERIDDSEGGCATMLALEITQNAKTLREAGCIAKVIKEPPPPPPLGPTYPTATAFLNNRRGKQQPFCDDICELFKDLQNIDPIHKPGAARISYLIRILNLCEDSDKMALRPILLDQLLEVASSSDSFLAGQAQLIVISIIASDPQMIEKVAKRANGREGELRDIVGQIESQDLGLDSTGQALSFSGNSYTPANEAIALLFADKPRRSPT